MAFYFPPTRSVTTAARVEYLRILHSTQEKDTPSPSAKVPDLPKPAASPRFKKMRAKISRKRHKLTESLKSDSSSTKTRIDRTRESLSTSSSDGTTSSVISYPETHSESAVLSGSKPAEHTQEYSSMDVKEVNPADDEDEKAATRRGNNTSKGAERVIDDLSHLARHTKNYNILRGCANLLTHPFTPDFIIDPAKLNSSSALLSILQAGLPLRLQGDELRVLDLGGRISDKYARSIEQVAHVTVIKAVQENNGSEVADKSSKLAISGLRNKAAPPTQVKEPLPLIVEDLSRLPLPSGSVQAISARSLYKDMTTAKPRVHSLKEPPGQQCTAEEILRDCLRECHRVLNKRGIIEYIYFDRKVKNPGPLITEMEDYFDSLSRHSETVGSEILSIDKFLDLLEDTGFAGGKSVVLHFPYTMLSKIFTKDGQRRASFPGPICLLDNEDDTQRLLDAQFIEEKSNNDAARTLFADIEKEASLLNSSWKCVVGWTVKTSRRR